MSHTKKTVTICLLSEYFPPDMGGGATRASNLARALFLYGTKTWVIAGCPHYPVPAPSEQLRLIPSWSKEDGLSVVRVFVPPLPSKGIFRRLILFLSYSLTAGLGLVLLRAKTREVTFIYGCTPQVLSILPAVWGAFLFHCQVILDVPDLYPESLLESSMISPLSPLTSVARLLALFAYKTAAHITTISEEMKNLLCDLYGVPISKVHVLPSAVDTSIFSASRPGGKQAPTLGPGDGFIVSYAGIIGPLQDFESILQAAVNLSGDPSIHFFLAGTGERREQLRVEIETLKLKNVSLLGKLTRSQVAELIRSSHIGLVLLRQGNQFSIAFPTKLFEYLASGKPIITTISGEAGKLLQTLGQGIVIKPGDVDALVGAILSIKQNYESYMRSSKKAQDFVEKNYSLTSLSNAFENILGERD